MVDDTHRQGHQNDPKLLRGEAFQTPSSSGNSFTSCNDSSSAPPALRMPLQTTFMPASVGLAYQNRGTSSPIQTWHHNAPSVTAYNQGGLSYGHSTSCPEPCTLVSGSVLPYSRNPLHHNDSFASCRSNHLYDTEPQTARGHSFNQTYPWESSKYHETPGDIRSREFHDRLRHDNPYQPINGSSGPARDPGFLSDEVEYGSSPSLRVQQRQMPLAPSFGIQHTQSGRSEHSRDLPIRSTPTPVRHHRSPSSSPGPGLPSKRRCIATQESLITPQRQIGDHSERHQDFEEDQTDSESDPISDDILGEGINEADTHAESLELSNGNGNSTNYHCRVIYQCEFIDPCKMTPSPDGMHHRKVVSHVFGRNKKSTKQFPEHVWVHYCRKHYQRARYRADQWPFTQCDLILESLRRMEEWGGVESFNLTLRRREQQRIDLQVEPNELAGPASYPTPASSKTKPKSIHISRSGIRFSSRSPKSKRRSTLPNGRKHPTAVISPAPVWLRSQVGTEKSFEDIRKIILRIKDHMTKLRNNERRDRDASRSKIAPAGESAGTTSGHRRSSWRSVDKKEPRLHPSSVRFPDIEILPTFRPQIEKAAARRARKACRGQARVMDAQGRLIDLEEEDEGRFEGSRCEIGQAGGNSDQSARQRTRNQKAFMTAVYGVRRVSREGAVKKLSDPGGVMEVTEKHK